ncbi:lipopolysaccharide core heptose(II) kinase RfaY [Fusobacterium perfoetens]|uniref:lipopolysaccharide core heptose(II) kinase RfaY n=1 Tax=Fusobacterium perfoetens TaxID=852 RepID=UPI0026E99D6E|nr:lipopolysaccharide core heptose(II) kinase RfaY [Fusobacterium perfoetens]
MLVKEKYKEKNIFCCNENYLQLGKKIIDLDYKIIKYLKNTKRNYVIVIEIENKKYVLKEPKNEFRIPQRKLMTFFKKGEVLTTLNNVNQLLEEGFKEFVKPLVAITQRKKGMICYSALLMEYYDGIIDISKRREMIELVKKMHEKRRYHGDFNPGNFLCKNNELKIIDTQAKKILLGDLKKHYDMLTMKLDSYKEMEYPYKKDIWYYLALGIKKVKRLKIVEKIKEKKKELRDKGWKI